MAEDVSHCSCALPEKAWGSGGWHHARFVQEQLVQRLRKDVESLNISDQQQRRARAEMLWNTFYSKYLGLPFAYEPCPAYRASCRERHEDTRQAKAAAQRARQERELE